MFSSTTLTLAFAALAASAPSQIVLDETTESCKYLYKNYPNATIFPGSERYTYEDTGKPFSSL